MPVTYFVCANNNRSSGRPGPRRRVAEPAGGYQDILGPFLVPETEDETATYCQMLRLASDPRRLAEDLRCFQAKLCVG
ncbi:hypothetical protein SAMN07250955_101200 [Arboricoccus pini]|uniref:Uncharacterized protein n=1 Tax=Arboricoccus pini TaxID=1963835 RepID=A0A212PYW2_9PROT|nr:hypothetical protein [Arboricoccus pini]SNB52179.1 hypothetical protein SAMN07250955_101200 [Arboricoccus pini]